MSKKTEMTEEERLETINTLSNGFGQTLLSIVDGNWDLAKSVAATLLASCIAQGALEHEDDLREAFEETGTGVWAATEAFYAEFKAAEEAEDDVDG